ncbi:class II glutamine amidotransferase [Adhaeribacter sp. BT258]|uniref:Class II glutamine amidotransferase n=1 Tax=Adhaeribacter terrigena TaxID=2793070 RepID=A0ABS1C0F2_9BACT|nr:class II glutamine amidotransferase [Adhaeribacter terrigena]MBK0402897.1 class II glutamine amidotransferase [Adhaeribacter terrigena]
MCRFVAYIGKPIMMYDLLFKPKNSLINQSVKAHEAEEPLNGDGFGIGWYTPEANDMPGLFVSVRPAWNDRNLKYIAPKIVSDCMFAHVRAASISPVNELNCHPFHYGNYLFMHNGDIEGFPKIKREMVRHLPENIYANIEGLTDSEHLFALFLHQLEKQRSKDLPTKIANALEDAIVDVEEIKARLKVKEPSYINVCVTDGDTIVAVRYVSDLSLEAPTLYYSEGAAYTCENGICRMKKSKNDFDKAVLIVSEKLTRYRSDWHEIPVNHMVTVNRKLEVNVSVIQRTLNTAAGF